MARYAWAAIVVAFMVILVAQTLPLNSNLQASTPEQTQTVTVGSTYSASTSYQNSTLFSNTFIVQNPPAGSECHWQTYTIVAEKGQTVQAHLSSNFPISLYIIPDANLSAWKKLNTCGPSYAIAAVGPATAAVLKFTAPVTATYDGVFLNSGNMQASVSVEVFILSPVTTTITAALLSTYIPQPSYTSTIQQETSALTPQTHAIIPAGMIILSIIIGALFVFMRGRRKPYPQQGASTDKGGASHRKQAIGYTPLEHALLGNINAGTSLVLLGPSSDERDALVRGFLRAGLSAGTQILSISNSPAIVESFLNETPALAHLILCGKQAGEGLPQRPNIMVTDSVENLTGLNITIRDAFKRLGVGRVSIEILSDVLLVHHATMTRKWLTGLLAKLKNANITTLAILDPSMHSTGEISSVVSLFDGEIDIVQRDVNGRLRRFLVVRRLRNQPYSEDEFPLEKGQE